MCSGVANPNPNPNPKPNPNLGVVDRQVGEHVLRLARARDDDEAPLDGPLEHHLRGRVQRGVP